MATPAQLMETVSAATGVPLATVVDIDRRLVKAGLRTKGGRGFNVPHMMALDAARLLTAILGSAFGNTAADAVERYACTHVDKRHSCDTLYAAVGVPELAALPARHGFVDALAALIAALATGSLSATAKVARRKGIPRVEVFAFTRTTHGHLRLSDCPGGASASVEYVPTSTAVSRHPDHRPGLNRDQSTGDLEQSRRVTERTLRAIATILRAER